MSKPFRFCGYSHSNYIYQIYVRYVLASGSEFLSHRPASVTRQGETLLVSYIHTASLTAQFRFIAQIHFFGLAVHIITFIKELMFSPMSICLLVGLFIWLLAG